MSAQGESCILNVLSKKAGLCDNVKVMRRANELHRLLQSHGCLGTTASLGASATALAVICLHLAAEEAEVCTTQIQQILMKLSGVKSKAQFNILRENSATSLGVQKYLTVEEICVKLGCPQNRIKSLEMLSNYAKKTPNSCHLKLESSLFSCAAVAAACKLTKTSYDRNELMNLSRSKRSLLLQVTSSIIEAFTSKSHDCRNVVEEKGLLQNIMGQEIQGDGKLEVTGPVHKRRKTCEEEDEDFEKWKNEMLRLAN